MSKKKAKWHKRIDRMFSELPGDDDRGSKTQRKLLRRLAADGFRGGKVDKSFLQLFPNFGRRLKLGKYSFGLSQTLELGKPSTLYMSDSPPCFMRTTRVTMNAPTVGFATVSAFLIRNTAVMMGGAEDAYAYASSSYGNDVDYPTLAPWDKATVSGDYTGFTPKPLAEKQPFSFSVRLSGICAIRIDY